MTTVLRCNVCGTHSDDWTPRGWKRVSEVHGSMPMLKLNGENNICGDCWDFLVDNRGDGRTK